MRLRLSSASDSGRSAAVSSANAAASAGEPVNSSARASACATSARRASSSSVSKASVRWPVAAWPSVRISASPSSSTSAGRDAAGRRLVERALEVGDAALGRAALDGGPARLAQLLDHPLLPAPRRGEQVRRDLLGGRAGVEQHARRALVLQLALAERQLLVDGVADQRVDEGDRRLAAQDLGPREHAGGVGDARLGEPGQRGDGGQRGALGQHGDGAGDRDRVHREPRRAA